MLERHREHIERAVRGGLSCLGDPVVYEAIREFLRDRRALEDQALEHVRKLLIEPVDEEVGSHEMAEVASLEREAREDFLRHVGPHLGRGDD